MKKKAWEAIVVGGGHAGVEAARALASAGHTTLLLTLDKSKIGAMSCNPAIGGVAKSHLVFEVDALGGWMGRAADLTGIQSRRLNLNRGPAVRSTRVQCDKERYQKLTSENLPLMKNLEVIEGEATELLFDQANKVVSGVRLKDGSELTSRVVIVTSGTFMGGVLFCGESRQRGGRMGDRSSEGLSLSIARCGHLVRRLKTGTPARLRANTIDFSQWEAQWGDPERRTFSWKSSHDGASKLPQLCCYIGHTTEQTHDVIRANFSRSPLYSGEIVGTGPRYCPSIEDKVRRFAERPRHQIFLEPEGLDSQSIYPNGLSTCLPADVQLEFLRTLPGLSRVELLRPGYAVEYDVFDPRELNKGLGSQFCAGLFLAGQINRTSGYEEAAAQGLWAGINASRYIEGLDPLVPDRSRSYMETLVDDLTQKGTEEPYRMFTSRSEFRLLLREDNVHERMFDLGREHRMISDAQAHWLERQKQQVCDLRERFFSARVRLSEDRSITLFEYLKRPQVTWEQMAQENLLGETPQPCSTVLEKVEIEAKYSGYLQRQESELKQYQEIKSWGLRENFDVRSLPSLSSEVVEKVLKAKPKNIAELAALSGVTPAAVLLIARAAGVRKESSVSRETTFS